MPPLDPSALLGAAQDIGGSVPDEPTPGAPDDEDAAGAAPPPPCFGSRVPAALAAR